MIVILRSIWEWQNHDDVSVYDILSRALSESEHVVILHIKYVRNKLVSLLLTNHSH